MSEIRVARSSRQRQERQAQEEAAGCTSQCLVETQLCETTLPLGIRSIVPDITSRNEISLVIVLI